MPSDNIERQTGDIAAIHFRSHAILTAPADDRCFKRAQLPGAETHHREPTLEPSADTVAAVKALVGQAGAMPITKKRQHKALFRALGKLKASVHAYEARRKTRKNVLPSALFSSQSTAATPEPEAASIPIAEPPHEPASPPEPVKVKSSFGEVPKPKIRRNKPGAAPS